MSPPSSRSQAWEEVRAGMVADEGVLREVGCAAHDDRRVLDEMEGATASDGRMWRKERKRVRWCAGKVSGS